MQLEVRDADRIITQYGSSLAVRAGHTLVDVDEAAWRVLRGAFEQPNGGVVFNADGMGTALPVAPAPPPTVGQRAEAALKALDWSALIASAQTGQSKLDDLTAQIALVNAAGSLASVKTPLVMALSDVRQFLQGTLDELVTMEKRWRTVLQALVLTDDASPPEPGSAGASQP